MKTIVTQTFSSISFSFCTEFERISRIQTRTYLRNRDFTQESLNRSLSKIRKYTDCTRFEYFFTLTFSDEIFDMRTVRKEREPHALSAETIHPATSSRMVFCLYIQKWPGCASCHERQEGPCILQTLRTAAAQSG